MYEEFDKVVATTEQSQERAAQVVEKLFDVTQPNAVYSEPVAAGDHTIITAAEVSVGMGYGFGMGGGSGRGGPSSGEDEDESAMSEGQGTGMGGGGGGGGGANARPVAVISVGPEGVGVEPVVDPTKIAIAFFTTLGSMFFMLSNRIIDSYDKLDTFRFPVFPHNSSFVNIYSSNSRE